ncbi:MAG TPA: ABC transporter substrate-binding protein [Anaerolineales bacterium]|nr:ABC transporter substrate-binding protein [Anaerolineales bacterium]
MSRSTRLAFPLLVLCLSLWSCAPAPTVAPAVPPVSSPAGAAPTESQKLIHFKVGFANFASNAPIYFALKEGFFKEEGLDVELVTFASANEIYPALIAGQVDAVAWSLAPAIFNAAAQGIHAKFVADKGFASTSACAADAWLASKQALAAGLSDPSTLKGKTVAVTRGSISEYALDLMLARGGLTAEDVQFTQITDNPTKVEALRSGTLDAAPLGEPWITYATSQGAAEVWMRYSDILPNQSVAFVSYGPTVLDKNPEAGVRFMAGYLRGIDQFNKGKTDRNIELISEYTKISADDLKAACWNTFAPNGVADVNGLLAYQQWLLDKGLVEKALPVDQFWTDEFVLEAAKRLGR